MFKSSIKKINDHAYFIIDLPSYLGTIITYDHTIANQTICQQSNNPHEEVIEEIPQKENQEEK